VAAGSAGPQHPLSGIRCRREEPRFRPYQSRVIIDVHTERDVDEGDPRADVAFERWSVVERGCGDRKCLE